MSSRAFSSTFYLFIFFFKSKLKSRIRWARAALLNTVPTTEIPAVPSTCNDHVGGAVMPFCWGRCSIDGELEDVTRRPVLLASVQIQL